MREQTMPTLILVFSVTVAAAGHVWLSLVQLYSTCIAFILLVESVLVHWGSNAFPDIECCLSPL